MAKKNNLFLLIKSLTKAEKRYFRLFATMSGNNKNYLQLFDFIDRQECFDEQKVKKKFANEAFANQLHVTKNYLSKLILKSLRNFHSQFSKDAELKDLLRDIEILFMKELFDQCRYAIEKAEKLACAYEAFPEMLAILAWKRQLLLATTSAGAGREGLAEIIDQEKKAVAKLSNLNNYWALTINMFDLWQAASKSENAPLGIFEHPDLQSIDSALSLQAKILYRYIWNSYYFFHSDYEGAKRSVDQLIRLIESRPERIRENPKSYITALNNYISVHLHLKELEGVPPLLEKIRSIPEVYGMKAGSKTAVKLLLQTWNVELEMYRDAGDCDAGIARIDEIEQYIQKYRRQIPVDYILILYYQFAYFYFMKKSFRDSLERLNEIFALRADTVREDILSYAQLLHLVVQYELGNLTILKYAVDSCRRFLKKKRDLRDFEMLLLKFFSKASMTPRSDHAKLFKKLDLALKEKCDPRLLKSALDYLDFKGWIEKKL